MLCTQGPYHSGVAGLSGDLFGRSAVGISLACQGPLRLSTGTTPLSLPIPAADLLCLYATSTADKELRQQYTSRVMRTLLRTMRKHSRLAWCLRHEVRGVKEAGTACCLISPLRCRLEQTSYTVANACGASTREASSGPRKAYAWASAVTLLDDCSRSDTTNSPDEIGCLDGGKSAVRQASTLCRSDRNGGEGVPYLPRSRQLFSIRER
jgi:hypothetical protein